MGDRRGHPEARLSAFLDDELPEADALAVARHVTRCPGCRDELEELRAARTALRELPTVRPPASLLTDMLDGVPDGDGPRRGARTATVAVAGVVTLLLVAFVVGGDETGEVVPPVDLVVVDHVARTGGGPVIVPADLNR